MRGAYTGLSYAHWKLKMEESGEKLRLVTWGRFCPQRTAKESPAARIHRTSWLWHLLFVLRVVLPGLPLWGPHYLDAKVHQTGEVARTWLNSTQCFKSNLMILDIDIWCNIHRTSRILLQPCALCWLSRVQHSKCQLQSTKIQTNHHLAICCVG